MLLKDVAYVVEAHFELTDKAGSEDTAARHISMFNRQARAGRTFQPISLGAPEFPAQFALIEEEGQLPLSFYKGLGSPIDLGWMLYDLDFAHGRTKRYFRAKLDDGVVAVPPPDSPDLMA